MHLEPILFFTVCFFGVRMAIIASSKTVFSPFCVKAEHSTQQQAPICQENKLFQQQYISAVQFHLGTSAFYFPPQQHYNVWLQSKKFICVCTPLQEKIRFVFHPKIWKVFKLVGLYRKQIRSLDWQWGPKICSIIKEQKRITGPICVSKIKAL